MARPTSTNRRTEATRVLERRERLTVRSEASAAALHTAGQFKRFLDEQLERVQRTTTRSLRRVRRAQIGARRQAIDNSGGGDRVSELEVSVRGSCGSDIHPRGDEGVVLL